MFLFISYKVYEHNRYEILSRLLLRLKVVCKFPKNKDIQMLQLFVVKALPVEGLLCNMAFQVK